MLSLPGPLVSVDWLADHLTDPRLRIADVRWTLGGPPGRDRYDAGHIAGAIHLDAGGELSSPGQGPGRHPIPAPDRFGDLLGARGIGDEHVVVAYDDAGGSIAARLWWLFRHFGHPGACAVLDGGIDAWTDAGHPLVTDAPDLAPSTWTAHPTGRGTLDADGVQDALEGGALLLDARAGERYRGEIEPIDPRAGHIPGALSAPWSTNVDDEGRFLARGTLRARYAAIGADARPTIAYCGSGLTATHTLLALELAGLPGARLYPGSWSDWSSDRSRPVATGATP